MWAVLLYAHRPSLPFLQNFLIGFRSDGPCECTSQIQSPQLYPVLRLIAIEILGMRTPNLGKRRAQQSGMVSLPLERALVSSYRPSIVTVPLSLRVSVFHLPLLCSSTPLFPTHLQSPKNFPGSWTNVKDRRPGGRTDRRTTRNLNALQCITR